VCSYQKFVEKSAEILPVSTTKKLVRKLSDFHEKFVVIKFTEYVRKLFELRFFLDMTSSNTGLASYLLRIACYIAARIS
jgi:hypothetical protein